MCFQDHRYPDIQELNVDSVSFSIPFLCASWMCSYVSDTTTYHSKGILPSSLPKPFILRHGDAEIWTLTTTYVRIHETPFSVAWIRMNSKDDTLGLRTCRSVEFEWLQVVSTWSQSKHLKVYFTSKPFRYFWHISVRKRYRRMVFLLEWLWWWHHGPGHLVLPWIVMPCRQENWSWVKDFFQDVGVGDHQRNLQLLRW